jgi:hypothetical protein
MLGSEDWISFYMYTHLKELWIIKSFILYFVHSNSEVYLGCRNFLLWICLEIHKIYNKMSLFFFLSMIVSCSYTITVDRISVIDWNSISSKCIGLKHLYNSISTTFYFVKGRCFKPIHLEDIEFQSITEMRSTVIV